MKHLLVAAIILLSYTAYSQSRGSLQGKVVTDDQSPAAATVLLLREKDSTIYKTTIASSEGKYFFSDIVTGTYLLSVSQIGYKNYIGKPVFVADTIGTVADIILGKDAGMLSNVTVTARKPLIQQQFDKLIFNVSGNISAAGNSALEMLEKAPGVFVDANGNISLGGRSGVLVLIDGKRTHLSEGELAAYLRGLPANSIDRIDLISNPSSQYEAAGTSGIIDIRLKKDNRYGYNGSVSLAYIQGISASGNGSVNFNYRTKKINLYALLSQSHNHTGGTQQTERNFFVNGTTPAGGTRSDNTRDFRFNNTNMRTGLDYYLSPRTIIGLMAMKTLTDMKADYTTRLDNFYLYPDSTNYSVDKSLTVNNRNSSSVNFNIKHTIDSSGKEWNLDMDYVEFDNRDDIDLRANFFNKDKTEYQPFYNLLGDLNGKMQVYVSQLDLHLPKTFTGNLHAGLRASFVSSDNALAFFNNSSGTPVPDVGRTNRFKYKENINAAFINYQRKIKKLSIQPGLRLEITNGEGRQLTTNQLVKRSYAQLFPNLFLGYDFTDKYNMGLSIARRIDRPSYNQLNPFRFYGNPFGYTEGDPFLKPQLTVIAEWIHTFNKKYIVRMSYINTTDVIGMVWGNDTTDIRISAQRPVNMKRGTFYRTTITVPVTIKNIFTSFNNITGTYNKYKGEAFNTVLNRGLPSFSVSSNNTFQLSGTVNVELNAWYRSETLASAGSQRFLPAGAVSAGVGKRILSGKGNIRLNVSDIFKTNVGHGVTRLHNYELYVKQWNETRRATLSFTYNFGKTSIAAARNRTTSAEDERRRASN